MRNVAAAIFIKNSLVFITKRAPNEKLAGYWEFPGGKQEQDESIFECLEREIFEELNVKCEAIKIYHKNIHHYEKGSITLIAILADMIDSTIQLRVHDDYKWVNVNDLCNYNFAPADIPIVQKLINDYGNDE